MYEAEAQKFLKEMLANIENGAFVTDITKMILALNVAINAIDENQKIKSESGVLKNISNVINNRYYYALKDLKEIEEYGGPIETVEYPEQTYDAGYANGIKTIGQLLNVNLPTKDEVYAEIDKEEQDLEDFYEECSEY